MEIKGIPQSIAHDDWIGFLQACGFDTDGTVQQFTVDNYGTGARITLRNGDHITVPFKAGRVR